MVGRPRGGGELALGGLERHLLRIGPVGVAEVQGLVELGLERRCEAGDRLCRSRDEAKVIRLGPPEIGQEGVGEPTVEGHGQPKAWTRMAVSAPPKRVATTATIASI